MTAPGRRSEGGRVEKGVYDNSKPTVRRIGTWRALSISVAAGVGATSTVHAFFEILSAVFR